MEKEGKKKKAWHKSLCPTCLQHRFPTWLPHSPTAQGPPRSRNCLQLDVICFKAATIYFVHCLSHSSWDHKGLPSKKLFLFRKYTWLLLQSYDLAQLWQIRTFFLHQSPFSLPFFEPKMIQGCLMQHHFWLLTGSKKLEWLKGSYTSLRVKQTSYMACPKSTDCKEERNYRKEVIV